jgi:Mg2+ and Co2+ transporter CorA
VPTLIAGVFGSNTQIPGQGEWWGFGLLVLLMVAGATGAWLLFRAGRRR